MSGTEKKHSEEVKVGAENSDADSVGESKKQKQKSVKNKGSSGILPLDKLVAAIVGLGFSQHQIAQMSGISKQYLSKILSENQCNNALYVILLTIRRNKVSIAFSLGRIARVLLLYGEMPKSEIGFWKKDINALVNSFEKYAPPIGSEGDFILLHLLATSLPPAVGWPPKYVDLSDAYQWTEFQRGMYASTENNNMEASEQSYL